MIKRVETLSKYVNINRLKLEDIISLYYSGIIHISLFRKLFLSKLNKIRKLMRKKRIIKKPKKRIVKKVVKKIVKPKKVKKIVKKPKKIRKIVKKPVKIVRKKPKKIKKIIRKPKKFVKLKRTDWFSMRDVIENYYLPSYPNLQIDATEIYNYYRCHNAKYYKLLNTYPSLPDLNKKVSHYKVYCILDTQTYPVLKMFRWKNEKGKKRSELIKMLLSHHPQYHPSQFTQVIEVHLRAIFITSKYYRFLEFVGIAL